MYKQSNQKQFRGSSYLQVGKVIKAWWERREIKWSKIYLQIGGVSPEEYQNY